MIGRLLRIPGDVSLAMGEGEGEGEEVTFVMRLVDMVAVGCALGFWEEAVVMTG